MMGGELQDLGRCDVLAAGRGFPKIRAAFLGEVPITILDCIIFWCVSWAAILLMSRVCPS